MVPIPTIANYHGLVEGPESQRFTLGSKWKVTRSFGGLFSDCVSFGVVFGRGTTLVFTVANYGPVLWVVAETRCIKSRGGMGRVEIDFESLSGQVPPDEFDLQPDDEAPKIERNPLFLSLTTDDFADVSQAFGNTTTGGQLTGSNKIASNALKQKLLDKMRNGMETYYYPAWRYTWSAYSFLDSNLAANPNLGGTQTTGKGLGGPLALTLASGGWSWLRQADAITIGNVSPFPPSSGVFLCKLTRTWIGAKAGFWDADIYPSSD